MALPCLIATPALLGFYLSLGLSLAAEALRSPDLLWGGLVIFLVNGIGAVAYGRVARRQRPRGHAGPAAWPCSPASAMTLAAIETVLAAAFLAGYSRSPARASGRGTSWAPTAS